MTRLCLLRSTMVALLAGAAPALAADQTPARDPTEEAEEQPARPGPGGTQAAVETGVSSPVPVYAPPPPSSERPFEPPRRGKPRGRVGGGSRGPGSAGTLAILALVPEHVARSAAAQPSLFWHIDKLPEAGASLVFTLIDERSTTPLREVQLPMPAHPGIERIRLSELGLELEPGRQYEWSVAIVRDPAARSTDIVASGWIDRVVAPSSLAGELRGASALGAVNVYAQHGLWYDAMTSISDLIEAKPDDPALLRGRAALLEQVGLQAAVDEPL